MQLFVLESEKVDKFKMYTNIKRLSDQGVSQRQIAKQLGLSRNTVSQYLKRDAKEMSTWLAGASERKRKLDPFKEEILSWIRQYPDLSASQIQDWLEERHQFTQVSSGSVRLYVRELREDYGISKDCPTRQYEAIPDPPMGDQAQLDFGQIWVQTSDGRRLKLYVMALVLSHSRYKYMEWWDRPYTSTDVISAHERAFQFFGGKPKTIVYDQDRTIIINENHGDILFTQQFESYRQAQHFKVYACRKSDPETKGRIENVIGYIKKNFAKNRLYTTLDQWNEEARAWLSRRGNGKVHNTTRKVPAVVFQEEKLHLSPITVSSSLSTPTLKETMDRFVRKDNTVSYKGNRYSVPLGTYHPKKIVQLSIKGDQLIINDKETNTRLTEHSIWRGKGELIKKSRHGRDFSKGIPELITSSAQRFGYTSLAETFFRRLHQARGRYIRDQLSLINKLWEKTSEATMNQALMTCMKRELFSASDFQSVVVHLKNQERHPVPVINRSNLAVSSSTQDKIARIKTESRDLTVYMQMLGGTKNETPD